MSNNIFLFSSPSLSTKISPRKQKLKTVKASSSSSAAIDTQYESTSTTTSHNSGSNLRSFHPSSISTTGHDSSDTDRESQSIFSTKTPGEREKENLLATSEGNSSSFSSSNSPVKSPPFDATNNGKGVQNSKAEGHQQTVKSVRWQLDNVQTSPNNSEESGVGGSNCCSRQGEGNIGGAGGEGCNNKQGAGEMMTGGKRKSSGSRIKAWIDKKLSCESDGGSTSSSFDDGLFSPPANAVHGFQVITIVIFFLCYSEQFGMKH